MSFTFSKTGVHVFPFVVDMAPGNAENLRFDAEGPYIGTPVAKLRNIATDAFLTDPAVTPAGKLAIVRVIMPDDAEGEVFSLRVTFTNAEGRIWSAAIVIPCRKI